MTIPDPIEQMEAADERDEAYVTETAIKLGYLPPGEAELLRNRIAELEELVTLENGAYDEIERERDKVLAMARGARDLLLKEQTVCGGWNGCTWLNGQCTVCGVTLHRWKEIDVALAKLDPKVLKTIPRELTTEEQRQLDTFREILYAAKQRTLTRKFDEPWVVHYVGPDDAYNEFDHLFFSSRGAIGHSPKPDDHPLGYTRFRKGDAERIVYCVNNFDAVVADRDELQVEVHTLIAQRNAARKEAHEAKEDLALELERSKPFLEKP